MAAKKRGTKPKEEREEEMLGQVQRDQRVREGPKESERKMPITNSGINLTQTRNGV